MSEKEVEVELRDVAETCKQIIDIIPGSEIELMYQVRKFHDSLWNQAPELRSNAIFWKQLANILNKNIDSFEKEWERKILNLFNSQ